MEIEITISEELLKTLDEFLSADQDLSHFLEKAAWASIVELRRSQQSGDSGESLLNLMDKMGKDAQAKGLTPETLELLLADE